MNIKTSDIIIGKPFTFTRYRYACGAEHNQIETGNIFVKSHNGIVGVNCSQYWGGTPPVEFYGFEYVELEIKEKLYTFRELPLGLAINKSVKKPVPFIKLSNTSWISVDNLKNGPLSVGTSSAIREFKPINGTLEVKS